jgi:hypothetical protein
MNDEKPRQYFGTVNYDFWVVFSQKVQKPLLKLAHAHDNEFSVRIKTLPSTHTLFVTVLANFRMLAVLPFSQRMSVYISRTFVPSCLFVRVVEAISLPSNNVVSIGRLGPFDEIVPDRAGRVPYCVLGVREVVLVG